MDTNTKGITRVTHGPSLHFSLIRREWESSGAVTVFLELQRSKDGGSYFLVIIGDPTACST